MDVGGRAERFIMIYAGHAASAVVAHNVTLHTNKQNAKHKQPHNINRIQRNATVNCCNIHTFATEDICFVVVIFILLELRIYLLYCCNIHTFGIEEIFADDIHDVARMF